MQTLTHWPRQHGDTSWFFADEEGYGEILGQEEWKVCKCDSIEKSSLR